MLYQLANDYEARGEDDVAEQIYDRILRDFPSQGLKILRAKRDAELAGANWSEAGRLHERIESLLSESGDPTQLESEEAVRTGLAYQRAVECLESDRIGEAKGLLDEILARDAGNIPALILQGEAEAVAGRPQEAVKIWRRGYASTGRPVFLLRIEDHFIERHEPLEAIENLHQVIAASEQDGLPRFFLGRLYYRLEMLDESVKVLEPLAERFESSATLHYLLGRIHQRRGEMGQAVASYQTCAQQAGIATPSFTCRHCRHSYGEWHDRCSNCGEWGGIELDLDVRLGPHDEADTELQTVYERAPWGPKS